MPPQPQDLSGLKGQLDKSTRSFLEESGDFKDSVVDDVRNYVVVQTLAQVMLLFKGDLGRLVG